MMKMRTCLIALAAMVLGLVLGAWSMHVTARRSAVDTGQRASVEVYWCTRSVYRGPSAEHAPFGDDGRMDTRQWVEVCLPGGGAAYRMDAGEVESTTDARHVTRRRMHQLTLHPDAEATIMKALRAHAAASPKGEPSRPTDIDAACRRLNDMVGGGWVTTITDDGQELPMVRGEIRVRDTSAAVPFPVWTTAVFEVFPASEAERVEQYRSTSYTKKSISREPLVRDDNWIVLDDRNGAPDLTQRIMDALGMKQSSDLHKVELSLSTNTVVVGGHVSMTVKLVNVGKTDVALDRNALSAWLSVNDTQHQPIGEIPFMDEILAPGKASRLVVASGESEVVRAFGAQVAKGSWKGFGTSGRHDGVGLVVQRDSGASCYPLKVIPGKYFVRCHLRLRGSGTNTQPAIEIVSNEVEVFVAE